MALAPSVETLEGLDDSLKGFYVEKNGAFVLDVDGFDNVAAAQKALKNYSNEAEKRRKELEKFKHIDPEEYARLKKEAEDRETKKLTDKGEFDKLRERWQAERDADKAVYEKELADRDTALRKYRLDDKVRAAALNAGVLAEDLEDVMVLTSRSFQLADDGSIQVLDATGQVTPKTVDEFFTKDFKARKPKFYAASGNSGGGTPPGGGAGGSYGAVRTRADFKTDKEKSDWIDTHGMEAFKKLPAK